MKLRPYQQEAIDRVGEELAQGRNRLLLQLGTGLGKTAIAASMIRSQQVCARFGSKPRVLFFVHREEIVAEAAKTFTALNPGAMVSIEQGPSYANRYADIVVASIQTLDASKGRRLADLIRYRPFPVTFCDEAHRATSASYIRTFVALGFLPPEDASDADGEKVLDADQLQVNLKEWDAKAPKDRVLIGLTATPNRTDGVGLAAVFQTIAYSFPLRKGVEAGYLVPPVPWVIDTTTSLDSVRTNRGDFNQGDLQDTVNTEERNRLTVAGWLKHAPGRPTIAFTAGVQHAHDLAAMFTSEGVVSRVVSGETPKEERRSILAEYRLGRVTLLANDSVFTEGTDLPTTSCVLMARPTKSALRLEQCIGRGLRTLPGDPVGAERLAFTGVLLKPDCILIDVIDVIRKHSLSTVASLYGLPPGLSSDTGKTLEELAQAWDAFAEAHPGINVEKLGRIAIEQLQFKATTFNIWEVPSLGAFGAGRAMNWLRVAADTFRIQYPWQDGTEVVTVAPDLLGQYAVSCTFRQGGGPYPHARRFQGQEIPPRVVRQRTLVTGVASASEAAAFAEKFISIDRTEVHRLTDKGAKWRKDGATEKQKSALRWRKVPFRADLTKGEAADLLNLARARAGQ